ncbi:LEAF RUST 10 DISEASE-RESISTANCE LOCUS RECEPTOR-LIKE PROTEIN KINASE-like 1.2 [Tripterygium wilfordii]|uniref:LEAF RUST 10 DISEASE-RESISTANCE LOCUS RECEPTOR-LIKE PROTEIN KINASE-like 1.2 n=1 Tax=Tripterygium wilfordii TaxID=458696 RepID=UPI0018F8287B|nr:LEAF RUST 10 DISEASE-RESISTANCE LOCUS RECEPTOR-LIKE PROTEIN KINASE-like 1.2 [Tripterygium wilfordii]
MSQNKLLLAAAFAFLAIHFHVSSSSYYYEYEYYDVKRIPYKCTQSSSCGNILNISYPFRLKGDPPNCGDPNYQLSCENNQTIFSYDSARFLVKAINYNKSTIRIADVGVQDGNCSSRPINSFDSYYAYARHGEYCSSQLYDYPLLYPLAYVSCESPVKSSTYVDAYSPCIIHTNSTNNRRPYHYVLVGNDHTFMELKVSCAIDFVTYTTLDGNYHFSYLDIHKKLVYGIQLSWHEIQCVGCRDGGFCRLENNTIIQSCESNECNCGFRCE